MPRCDAGKVIHRDRFVFRGKKPGAFGFGDIINYRRNSALGIYEIAYNLFEVLFKKTEYKLLILILVCVYLFI